MKTLNYAISFLSLLFIVACSSNSNDVAPNSLQESLATETQIVGGGEGEVEIGYFEGEEFYFTVSEDELQAVFNYNTELNLDQSGSLEEADVVAVEGDEAEHLIVLAGTVGEEGSASLSGGVNVGEVMDGRRLVTINVQVHYAGFCYKPECLKCRQSDLNDPANNRRCKCLSGGSGPGCPLINDPTFIWIH